MGLRVSDLGSWVGEKVENRAEFGSEGWCRMSSSQTGEFMDLPGEMFSRSLPARA